MLSVTFSQPIHIDAANLHSLLSLANAPALVEPYLNGVAVEVAPRPGRKPRITNGDPHAPAVVEPPKEDKPKRTRRTKAEMLAAKATAEDGPNATEAALTEQASTSGTPATPEAAGEVEAPKKPGRKPAAAKAADVGKSEASPTTSENVDATAMLERFAKLIDTDFSQAKAVLDGFGVTGFSKLEASQYAAFSAKLTELGV